MASDAVADCDPLESPYNTNNATNDMNHEPDEMDSADGPHDLDSIPARASELHENTKTKTNAAIDDPDAATTAASEELKHTSISDKILSVAKEKPTEPAVEDKEMHEEEQARVDTPEPETTDAQDEIMRERITSPKKKRGRDLDDDARDVEADDNDDTSSSPDGPSSGKRTIRSGPEKKRPRDTTADSLKTTAKLEEEKEIDSAQPASSTAEPSSKSPLSPLKPTFGRTFGDKPQTSSSAFASTSFASLASSASSPFGTIGSSKPNVFGNNAQTNASGFGGFAGSKSPSATTTITTAKNKPTLGFGFGGGSTAYGFSGLGSGSAFGSALGNGFAGGSGPKLSSFAAPIRDTATSAKPAKAFGAPESDEDEGSGDNDSDGTSDTDDEEVAKVGVDEKKKHKPSKVEDGESGEATLLQLRAKLFALESKEAGWKERGVGSLKINVPQSCVTLDASGVPIPGSFDISGLEDEEDSKAPKVPRLIMRQENTHRVVLNTIIVRAMEFNDKPSQTAAQILFTAFEGDEAKPISMLLKMSENNARLFRSEIESIQHEL